MEELHSQALQVAQGISEKDIFEQQQHSESLMRELSTLKVFGME